MGSVTREQIIQRAQQALDATSKRIRFEIHEAGVRKDGAWWYLPIFAEDRKGELLPRDFVISTYTNVEEELNDREGLNVLFIPFILSSAEPESVTS